MRRLTTLQAADISSVAVHAGAITAARIRLMTEFQLLWFCLNRVTLCQSFLETDNMARGPKAKGEYHDKSAVLSTRISSELRKMLEASVKKSGLTISREVEHRLRWSFLVENQNFIIHITSEPPRRARPYRPTDEEISRGLDQMFLESESRWRAR